MNCIGIDLGNKRVGLAIVRENIAFAHSIVARTQLVSHLKKMLVGENINHIIVGLPYDLYGKDTKQLEKTQNFIEKLKNIFPDIEILGHDERFSSFEAAQGYADHRDDVAAQCILQSFLDSKNSKK